MQANSLMARGKDAGEEACAGGWGGVAAVVVSDHFRSSFGCRDALNQLRILPPVGEIARKAGSPIKIRHPVWALSAAEMERTHVKLARRWPLARHRRSKDKEDRSAILWLAVNLS